MSKDELGRLLASTNPNPNPSPQPHPNPSPSPSPSPPPPPSPHPHPSPSPTPSPNEPGRLLANTNSGAGGYELTEQARADAKEAVTSQLSTGRHSRAFYRVSATRSATGGKDMVGHG